MKYVIILLFISFASKAQVINIDTTGKGQYCRLFINSANDKSVIRNSTRLNVAIDFGDEDFDSNNTKLLDENGKTKTFPSNIAILNYFYTKGWELSNLENAGAFSNHTVILRKRNGKR